MIRLSYGMCGSENRSEAPILWSAMVCVSGVRYLRFLIRNKIFSASVRCFPLDVSYKHTRVWEMKPWV